MLIFHDLVDLRSSTELVTTFLSRLFNQYETAITKSRAFYVISLISKYVILKAQQKQQLQTRTYTRARKLITRENDKPDFSL